MKTGYVLLFRSKDRVWNSSIHDTKREAELTRSACASGLRASFAEGCAIAECVIDDPKWETFIGQAPEDDSPTTPTG